MASIVGPLGGITYGVKLYGYFLIIGLIGAAITLVGVGMAVLGLGLPAMGTSVVAGSPEGLSPNLAQVLFGSVIALVGFGITQAGFLGAIYKIITDAVYTANRESKKTALSDEALSND
ncbi:hypothetical protein [Halobaculum rubrum]|uniref:hypothetical protein n=1 Tax=Halobaculum rubrum TaxID=2872158 RepID=UPI001CA39753|nr:hypothetical protein [Halobaculum rubrum]QZX99693.1 hypothetical protein K6T25_00855 [Halobaculum rubrum]